MHPEPRPPVVPRLAAWWSVLAVLVMGLVLIGQNHLLRGGVVLAGACFTGAGLRLFLPERYAGGLVVRSRTLDTLTYVALGTLVLVSSFVLNLSPGR